MSFNFRGEEYSGAANGPRHGPNGLVLADEARGDLLLHAQKALRFRLGELSHGVSILASNFVGRQIFFCRPRKFFLPAGKMNCCLCLRRRFFRLRSERGAHAQDPVVEDLGVAQNVVNAGSIGFNYGEITIGTNSSLPTGRVRPRGRWPPSSRVPSWGAGWPPS